MPDNIPEAAQREIRAAAERAGDDLRWAIGDGPNMDGILLHLATESWLAGRAHGAERDL